MTRQRQGLFITFEGTEGAGKSTLIQEVARQLTHKKSTPTLTREPGGSPVAEKVRELILDKAMDPWAELFLYEAARAEHMAKTVLPVLMRGGAVLCDRFTDSSLAYQAHARGLPWAEVKLLNDVATRGIKPDLTVLIDVDPAAGLKRAKEWNRFEAEGVAFQTKVRKGFLKSRREEPWRWITLKAYSDTPEKMAEVVVQEVYRRFEITVAGIWKQRSRGKTKRG